MRCKNDFISGLSLVVGLRVENSSEPGLTTKLDKVATEFVDVKLAFIVKYHYMQ